MNSWFSSSVSSDATFISPWWEWKFCPHCGRWHLFGIFCYWKFAWKCSRWWGAFNTSPDLLFCQICCNSLANWPLCFSGNIMNFKHLMTSKGLYFLKETQFYYRDSWKTELFCIVLIPERVIIFWLSKRKSSDETLFGKL